MVVIPDGLHIISTHYDPFLKSVGLLLQGISHSSLSVRSPIQSTPLLEGVGLLHCLVRVFCPTPQPTPTQGDQVSQSLNPPFTAEGKELD